MEQELHECGFPNKLGMPYWDWTRWPQLEASPMFDGSDTSLGGNGLYKQVPYGLYTTRDGTVLPQGTGGGCVVTGPFANHTVYFQRMNFFLALAGGLPQNCTSQCPELSIGSYERPSQLRLVEEALTEYA